MITHFLTDDDLVFTVYFGLVQCLIGTLESAPENVTVTHQGNSDANLNPAGSTTSIQVELFDARANTFADIDRTVDISLCQATDKFISSEDNDNGWDIRLNFEFEGLEFIWSLGFRI